MLSVCFLIKFFIEVNLRSSHLEVFYEKDVLTNVAKFTVKHMSRGLFFNKVAKLY